MKFNLFSAERGPGLNTVPNRQCVPILRTKLKLSTFGYAKNYYEINSGDGSV